jgi:hypothetical protein
MRHEARTSIETLGSTGAGTVHIINVTFVDGSIHVTPDPRKIHEGDSVCWEFRDIPDEWTRAIRFSQPAGVDSDRGPFTGSLASSFEWDAGKKVNTITGPEADCKPCTYKYDVVLTTPNGTRIELDPIIENEGPPNS